MFILNFISSNQTRHNALVVFLFAHHVRSDSLPWHFGLGSVLETLANQYKAVHLTTRVTGCGNYIRHGNGDE